MRLFFFSFHVACGERDFQNHRPRLPLFFPFLPIYRASISFFISTPLTVEQSNFGDFAVPRITDMPQVAVHIVPSAEPPTGMGEPGLPPLAPAFANAVARLTGKTPRELPFKLA